MSRRVEPYPARRPATPAEGAESRRSPPPVPPPHAHVMQDPRAPPPPHHYAYSMPRDYHSAYMYATQHPPPHTYGHDERYAAYAPPPPPAPYMPHGAFMAYPTSAPPMPPQGASFSGAPADGSVPEAQVTYTDDAGTKLSNGVRRRCFNCCTKETSTWRRSNLAAGKVLCNKCGLFERTHSRPRPEQFPHKRGPLAYSTVRSNEGANAQPTAQQSQYPPSASAPPGGGNHSIYAPYLTTLAGAHPPMSGLLPEPTASAGDTTTQNQKPPSQKDDKAPTPSKSDAHDAEANEAGKPNEGLEKHEEDQDADADADAERDGE